MATRSPEELVIPLDNFIYRIAWYVFTNNHEAAEVLRQLAADCRPAYRVDEAAVSAKVEELRARRDGQSRLD
jgi:hypothetical protein